MVQWYYVDGTERVGPVSLMEIENLINSEKLNSESYVWRKGFTNWEKVKNVDELNLKDDVKENVTEETLSHPTLIYSDIHKNDEVFFLRTGKDRESMIAEIFGPFSFVEIEEAYNGKRINAKTLIFAAGMDDWKEIGELEYFINKLNIIEKTVSLKSLKQMYVYTKINNEFVPMLIKEMNGLKLKLQSKKMSNIQTINGNIFLCNKVIAKNIIFKVKNIDNFNQELSVEFETVDRILMDQIEKQLND